MEAKIEHDDALAGTDGNRSKQLQDAVHTGINADHEEEDDHHDHHQLVDTRFSLSLPREIVFVAIVCLAQFVNAACVAQTIAPISTIAGSLSLAPSQATWPAAAFSLTTGTFVLIAGRVGDVWGHRRTFISAWMWLALWSLLCGFAIYLPSQPGVFFSVCRALQGIGAAFLVPSSLALLGTYYHNGRRKNMAFAIFASMSPSGYFAGSIVSSVFAQFSFWPWTFWICAMVSVIAAAVGRIAVPPDSLRPKFGRHLPVLQRFDIVGSILGVGGLVLFDVAWNQAPTVGWGNPQAYATLVAGVLLFAFFVFHELRTSNPLIPTSTLGLPAVAVLICLATGWSTLGTYLYYIFQFLQRFRGLTPLEATVQFSAEIVSAAVAALITGAILNKIRPELLMVGSMIGFCIGSVLIATAPVEQTYWANTFISLVIAAWG
jgi:MFS family permease